MHKIDRYGVIALVFMAVTFLAVYYWDDRGKARQPDAKKPVERGEVARLESRPDSKPQAPPHRPAGETRSSDLALSQSGAPERVEPQRAASERERDRARSEKNSVPRPMPEELPAQPTGTRTKADDAPKPLELQTPPPADSSRGAAERAPESPSASPKVAPAEDRGAPATRTYTVAKNDTLERIAARELGDGSRWTEIQQLNGGIDPKRLWVGAVLKLPAGGSSSVAARESKPAESAPRKQEETPAAGGRTYVVQKGDILGTIAQKELGTAKAWSRIAAANPGLNPDRLVPGMKIVIPGGADAKPAREPLELAKPSKSVARAEPVSQGGFKVR